MLPFLLLCLTTLVFGELSVPHMRVRRNAGDSPTDAATRHHEESQRPRRSEQEKRARAREKFKKAEADRVRERKRWKSALEKRLKAEKQNATVVPDEVRLEKSFNVWELYSGRKLACRDVGSPRMLNKLRRFKRFWKAAVKKHERTIGRLQSELVRYSEEDKASEEDIVNPMDRSLPDDEKVKALKRLTKHNYPLLKKLTKKIDSRLGTESKVSIKTDKSILNKAHRPSIVAEHPWFQVEHIRDSLRFMTAIQDVGQIADIMGLLAEAHIKLVKIDVKKLIKPKKWGWRFIAYDLRMENGQICEYYITFESLARVMWDTHRIYERWRQSKALRDSDPQFRNDLERSKTCYSMAFLSALNKGRYTANAFLERWRETLERMLHVLQTGVLPKDAHRRIPTRAATAEDDAVDSGDASDGLLPGLAIIGLGSVGVTAFVWWALMGRRGPRGFNDKIDKIL